MTNRKDHRGRIVFSREIFTQDLPNRDARRTLEQKSDNRNHFRASDPEIRCFEEQHNRDIERAEFNNWRSNRERDFQYQRFLEQVNREQTPNFLEQSNQEQAPKKQRGNKQRTEGQKEQSRLRTKLHAEDKELADLWRTQQAAIPPVEQPVKEQLPPPPGLSFAQIASLQQQFEQARQQLTEKQNQLHQQQQLFAEHFIAQGNLDREQSKLQFDRVGLKIERVEKAAAAREDLSGCFPQPKTAFVTPHSTASASTPTFSDSVLDEVELNGPDGSADLDPEEPASRTVSFNRQQRTHEEDRQPQNRESAWTEVRHRGRNRKNQPQWQPRWRRWGQ
jgi:hypothetical protein